jgi:hypothetical protein
VTCIHEVPSLNLNRCRDYPDWWCLRFPSVTPGKWLVNTLKLTMTTSSPVLSSSLMSLYRKYTCLYVISVQMEHNQRYGPHYNNFLCFLMEDRFFWYRDFSSSLTRKNSPIRQDENYDRLWKMMTTTIIIMSVMNMLNITSGWKFKNGQGHSKIVFR